MCDQSKCILLIQGDVLTQFTVTRFTTEYSRLPWLQRIVRCQAVSELTLLGRPRGFSDLAKLLDYMSQYPETGTAPNANISLSHVLNDGYLPDGLSFGST
jgi:hypothetical protein